MYILAKKTLLIFTTFISITSLAQENLSGNVIDQDSGQTIPGASVIIKGTSKGTITDFDGNFILSNVSLGDVLEFSYLGYKTKEITIEDYDNLSIILSLSSEALGEVIVTGYGSQRKRNILQVQFQCLVAIK